MVTPGKGIITSGPARITLAFLAFGILWTLFLGMALPSMVRDPVLYANLFAWKDWIFLALAALLVFLLARSFMHDLAESEQLYRTLVEDSGSIILTMDRDGNITFFNRYAEEVFGFRRQEVLGKNVIGTIVPGSESSGRDLDLLIQDIIASPGRYHKNRNENITSTGERIWVQWTNRALTDGTGFAAGVISVGTDLYGEKDRP